jgi:hypothetical protein
MATENITIDTIIDNVKVMETQELFKLMKALISEAEKKSKQTKTKLIVSKKSSSMPKGVVPQQLKKPRAWVEFTLKNANEKGWESFTILQKKKDKLTNKVLEEQIEMPGSVLHEGTYIYKDSINYKEQKGRRMIHKEAMSLSKHRKETNHSSYAEFEANYIVEETDDSKSETSLTSANVESDSEPVEQVKKVIKKMTASEKLAESEAKKKAKEEEKEKNKAIKEAQKAAKKKNTTK